MSDFFDKLKKGAKETGEKASILAKMGGLKAQIANLGAQKNGKAGELGKKVYSMFIEGTLPADILALLKTELDAVVAVDKEIEKANLDIANLNEDLKKVGATDSEIKEAETQAENKSEEPKS
jgi:predicted transcriptional regulator